MTREQFSAKIRWPAVAWLVSIIGIFTMVPQLWQILRTHQVRDLNTPMFVVAFLSQTVYGLQGFFKRDRMLVSCMFPASAITLAIIVCIFIWR